MNRLILDIVKSSPSPFLLPSFKNPTTTTKNKKKTPDLPLQICSRPTPSTDSLWWPASTGQTNKSTGRRCWQAHQNERIFGFAPHAQSTSFHVGKDILHDLSKVCCTQWVVAEIVAIAPAKKRPEGKVKWYHTVHVSAVASVPWLHALTCIRHTPLALGGKSLGAPLGDSVSSWTRTSVEYGLTTWNSDHWNWHISKNPCGEAALVTCMHHFLLIQKL